MQSFCVDIWFTVIKPKHFDPVIKEGFLDFAPNKIRGGWCESVAEDAVFDLSDAHVKSCNDENMPECVTILTHHINDKAVMHAQHTIDHAHIHVHSNTKSAFEKFKLAST